VEQTNVLRHDISFVTTIGDLVRLAEVSGVSSALTCSGRGGNGTWSARSRRAPRTPGWSSWPTPSRRASACPTGWCPVPAFFGGRYGYSRDRLLAGLGTRFLGDEISIKPYACCKYGHNAITAAITLRSDPDVSPGSIREVVVRVGQDTWDIICDPLSLKASPERIAGPDGLALAQFSLPFMVATALLRGRLSAAELDQEWRASPAVMPPSGGTAARGFGGHVAALALAAAYESVPPALSVHQVHVEFLRPAMAGRPLRLDARSIMTATFHRGDAGGLDYQCAMPPAPPCRRRRSRAPTRWRCGTRPRVTRRLSKSGSGRTSARSRPTPGCTIARCCSCPTSRSRGRR
jgi:MmgE/PrpD C-terminal domain/Thioesterase-like superfamily